TRSIILNRPALVPDASGDHTRFQDTVLINEINRTVFYTKDRFPQGSIHQIIMSGFGDWDMDQLHHLAHDYKMEVMAVHLSDVQKHFTGNAPDLTEDHLPLLYIAFNQGFFLMKGVDLLPEEPVSTTSWATWIPESTIPNRAFLSLA